MSARQQVALEPAFADVLTEDLHHPTVGRQLHVHRLDISHPRLAGEVDHGVKAIRCRFIRPEQSEVATDEIQAHDGRQKPAEDSCGLRLDAARRRDGHRELLHRRHDQRLQERATIGMRIGTHAPRAGRRERGDRVMHPSVRIEEFLRR